MTKLSIIKVRTAIKGTTGSITLIAQSCGVARINLYKFLDKYPYLKKEIEEERDKLVDKVEERLYIIATGGNSKDSTTLNAIKMILTKHKGYADKQEVEHSGSQQIDLSMVNMCKDYNDSDNPGSGGQSDKKPRC